MKKFLLLVFSLAVLSMPVCAGAGMEKGEAVYNRLCWWCHGRDGAGDGPASEYLNPPPRDFTMGSYKWKSTPFDEIMPAEEDYYKMIAGIDSHNPVPGWDGLNGTAMPGWAGVLGAGEIRDAAEYIKSLAGMEEPEAPPVVFRGGGAAKATLEQGRKLYGSRCAECHGKEGRGDGEKGLKDDWGARTWPRNLTKGWTFRAGSDAGAIYARVTVGIPGTQMPSFADPISSKVLTEEERAAVAYYAASLDEPYKKPGSDTVIKAVRVEGELPGPRGPGWEGAGYTSLYLVPQIVSGERLYTPSLDSISVKAAYNDSELALYLEWDDPTFSVPGDGRAEELAGTEVYPDRVAVEFPAGFEKGGKAPYFGMGSRTGEVNIWAWDRSGGAGVMKARGSDRIEKREAGASGLKAEGYYESGTWRVVFKRPLDTGGEGDIRFEEGLFTPIALAAWDGSNGEKGSRHVMTGWASLRLEPRPKSGLFIWPVIIALIVFGVEILWARSARRG